MRERTITPVPPPSLWGLPDSANAGPAFVENSKPHKEGGGTGVMVRSLIELLSNEALRFLPPRTKLF